LESSWRIASALISFYPDFYVRAAYCPGGFLGYSWILEFKSGTAITGYGCTLDSTGYILNGPIPIGKSGKGFPWGIEVIPDDIPQPWP